MKKVHGKEYVIEAFHRYDDELNQDAPSKPEDEFIIEYGFNLFVLTNILMLRSKKG